MDVSIRVLSASTLADFDMTVVRRVAQLEDFVRS